MCFQVILRSINLVHASSHAYTIIILLLHRDLSSRNFDASLRQRNPEWGIRDLESVQAEAKKCGLQFIKTVEMPANNLVVLFRKVS